MSALDQGVQEGESVLTKSLAAAAAAVLCACSAGVTYERATDDGTGIRYYEPSPYLLIYSNAKGGLKWQIVYLPDPTKLMMATPWVYGGRTEMTLYFHNGMLAGSTQVGDTTELAKSLVAAAQAALPLLAAAAAAPPTVPAPYIYKMVVNGDNVSFIGGEGAPGIKVPVVKGSTP